jgi:Flp pilus assembly protein TadD
VLVPLALLDGGVKPQAITATEQGTQAYQAKQFEEAKKYFEQAVTIAPQSGQAHYNYALALNALGDTEAARQHFLEAANLAPGDKTIWDSPALSPYGNPAAPKASKEHPYGTSRPGIGSGPR